MSYTNEIESLRQQQINSTQALKDAEARRLQEQTEQQVKQLQAQRPQLDQRFTDQAQQAYIQKKQAEKQLPQQMAAQGYNGGLAESSRIALDSRYGNSYNTLQRDYNGNLDTLNRSVDNARFQGGDALAASSNRYAGIINDTNMTYNQMLAQARQEEQARALQQQMQQAEFEQRRIQQQQQLAMQQKDYEYKAADAAQQRALQKEMQAYEWQQKQQLAAAELAAEAAAEQAARAAKAQTVRVSGGGGSGVDDPKPKPKATPPKTLGKGATSVYNNIAGWIQNDPTIRMNKYSAEAAGRVQEALQRQVHLGKISSDDAAELAKRLGY